MVLMLSDKEREKLMFWLNSVRRWHLVVVSETRLSVSMGYVTLAMQRLTVPCHSLCWYDNTGYATNYVHDRIQNFHRYSSLKGNTWFEVVKTDEDLWVSCCSLTEALNLSKLCTTRKHKWHVSHYVGFWNFVTGFLAQLLVWHSQPIGLDCTPKAHWSTVWSV